MTLEIIVLALVSTVRPTSLAAVYALLSTESPRRLMIVYVMAGLAFTVGFGLLVVVAFNGIDISSGTGRTKAVAQIAAGALVLVFAIGLLTGNVGGPHAEDAPRRKPSDRWRKLRERRFTLGTAALAGPVTHIPGLFYLIALNLIVAAHTSVPGALIELLIFNVIWFAIPLGALAVSIVEPDVARSAVGSVQDWSRHNARTIVLVVSFGLGSALVVRGLLKL